MKLVDAIGLGEAYALACALLWAVAVVLFKRAGAGLPPFALNYFKNLLGLALMLPTIALVPGAGWPEFPPLALALVLISGFIGIGLGDTFYFRALNTVGAARMAVAQALFSPFVILLSTAFLGERLSLTQYAGVLVLLSGIWLVTLHKGASSGDRRLIGLGMLTGIFSVWLMAVGIVIAKPLLEVYDFLWVVALRIGGGVLGMSLNLLRPGAAASLVADFRQASQWPAILVGSFVGTYLSMMVWLAGYKYTQASIAAVLNELASVFIVAFAVLFLGERLTRRQGAGMLVALAGVAVVVTG